MRKSTSKNLSRKYPAREAIIRGIATAVSANATARPLGWRVTSADLADLLHRIDQYQQQTAPTDHPEGRMINP